MRHDNCPICKRELGDDLNWNSHHLIPKTFKGSETVDIHRICHNKLHSVFSERELVKYYYTIDRIMENKEMQKYAKWISNKPIDFYTKTKDSTIRNKKRRR